MPVLQQGPACAGQVPYPLCRLSSSDTTMRKHFLPDSHFSVLCTSLVVFLKISYIFSDFIMPSKSIHSMTNDKIPFFSVAEFHCKELHTFGSVTTMYEIMVSWLYHSVGVGGFSVSVSLITQQFANSSVLNKPHFTTIAIILSSNPPKWFPL